MKVILLHDVPKVGRKFDVIDVADGYATNFLLPQKLGEVATAPKIAELDKRKEAAKVAEDARLLDLREKLATLADLTLVITAKADDQGHLYKKIHADDIVSALKDEHDIHLHKESILLDHPLHEVGDHEVSIEAAGEKATLNVQIVAE
jgi:large subunit ribosomal protein L9